MTDSAPPEAASPLDPVAKPAISRWARFLGQLKRFRGPLAAIAGIGAILSGLVGYWTAYENIHKAVAPNAAPAVVTADARPLSIVVLPFTNLTGDANQAYVADALTANLTANLFRNGGDVFVVDAATAFTYKNKPVTAQQVGRELGVRFVLQGSVQRSGNKIRISAQLADATSNAKLWSESVEGDQSDLFALQDQLRTRIHDSIGREMVIVAARESETRKSSPKAADLSLRLSALDLKPHTLKNFLQEENLGRQALALEPNNASAMAGLARTLTFEVANFGYQMDEGVQEKKMVEAHDLALKAKELDPDESGVYAALGLYDAFRGDWESGRRALETELSLNPKSPWAYVNLAFTVLFMGEPKRAIELLTQAINMDQEHPDGLWLFGMGLAYFVLGDNDAAIEWLLKSLDKDPARPAPYAYLAMAYALKGDDARARAMAADLRRLDPNETLSALRTKENLLRSATYKEWFESKLVPAWRKAGLPE